jgi:hypothetical protein
VHSLRGAGARLESEDSMFKNRSFQSTRIRLIFFMTGVLFRSIIAQPRPGGFVWPLVGPSMPPSGRVGAINAGRLVVRL